MPGKAPLLLPYVMKKIVCVEMEKIYQQNIYFQEKTYVKKNVSPLFFRFPQNNSNLFIIFSSSFKSLSCLIFIKKIIVCFVQFVNVILVFSKICQCCIFPQQCIVLHVLVRINVFWIILHLSIYLSSFSIYVISFLNVQISLLIQMCTLEQ